MCVCACVCFSISRKMFLFAKTLAHTNPFTDTHKWCYRNFLAFAIVDGHTAAVVGADTDVADAVVVSVAIVTI